MSRLPSKIIKLDKNERSELNRLVSQGRESARKIVRARIILLCDRGEEGPGYTDLKVAEILGVTNQTVSRVRSRFLEEGIQGLERRKHRRYKSRRLDGEAEAHLVALACGSPPEGHSQWTLRLLADRLVKLEIVDHISHETVRTTLKKTKLSLGEKTAGASPPRKTQRLSAPWKKS